MRGTNGGQWRWESGRAGIEVREQRGKVKGKGSREAKKERGDKEAER